MADQVEINLPKTVFDERSGFIATAVFRTRASAASSTPTTAEYKLFNLSTKETIKDWTTLTPAGSISITLDARDLTIRDRTHVMERIEIAVSADRGLSTEAVKTRHFKIRNIGSIE